MELNKKFFMLGIVLIMIFVIGAILSATVFSLIRPEYAGYYNLLVGIPIVFCIGSLLLLTFYRYEFFESIEFKDWAHLERHLKISWDFASEANGVVRRFRILWGFRHFVRAMNKAYAGIIEARAEDLNDLSSWRRHKPYMPGMYANWHVRRVLCGIHGGCRSLWITLFNDLDGLEHVLRVELTLVAVNFFYDKVFVGSEKRHKYQPNFLAVLAAIVSANTLDRIQSADSLISRSFEKIFLRRADLGLHDDASLKFEVWPHTIRPVRPLSEFWAPRVVLMYSMDAPLNYSAWVKADVFRLPFEKGQWYAIFGFPPEGKPQSGGSWAGSYGAKLLFAVNIETQEACFMDDMRQEIRAAIEQDFLVSSERVAWDTIDNKIRPLLVRIAKATGGRLIQRSQVKRAKVGATLKLVVELDYNPLLNSSDDEVACGVAERVLVPLFKGLTEVFSPVSR